MKIKGLVNFLPKQIGKFVSEVLILELPDDNGNVVLLEPTVKAPNNGKLF